MPDISLERQLRCARREVSQRHRVYPRMIERRTMTQAQADDELVTMQAIVQTLEQLVAEERETVQPTLF